MKILYMAPDLVPHPKGSGTRIEATVSTLASLGVEVTLVTPGGASTALRDERISTFTVDLADHADIITRMLSFRAGCRPLIARHGWDAIWFRSPWEGVPAVIEGRAPCIYECHGVPSIELPSHAPALSRDHDVMDNLVAEENLVLHAARKLVTPSRTGRTFLMGRGVSPERIEVVPNAVEMSDPVPPRASNGPLRLLYVGTLAPWQGVTTLFEALAFLRGHLDVTLTLVGTRKGTWLRDLRERASVLRLRSRIQLLGPRPRTALRPLMAEADVCVAPLLDDPRNSLQGCCPIKILEYMAGGRPILSTRLRAVEEIVRHGETAWLVEPSSPFALARGIQWMAAHPTERAGLALRAREEAATHWNPQGFATRIGAIVDYLASSR